MQVFVKTLSQRTEALDVAADWTVEQVKEAIFKVSGVDPAMQKLNFSGRMLENGQTLADVQISNESTLYLSLALLGGKKKKKVFTTKKKIKHKHKNIKLNVLNLYSIDGQKKIIRNRKQCPNPICGPGVFMARHFDRHYCGRCGEMIKVDKSEILKVEKKAKVETAAAAADTGKAGKKDAKKKK
eukprot:TRINITY_DN402_c0_g2_i1.p1 TRINITY_DN402_c0_g2~~TRINITY_DN402_c0_g2_i1.p1  ORF type:complete len:184 (-),score=75.82 TRINITY_DN402_c0_g2_i1:153-704(-)